MGWLVFSLIAYILLFILVPSSEYKAFFPFGLVSMIILYLIDSTLIKLGAFSYSFGSIKLSGLPALYLISGCAGGILFIYFLPSRDTWQLSYILLVSAIFLILELIMYWLKYFHYHNWSPFNSYFLNIFGFSVVLCFSRFLGYPRK